MFALGGGFSKHRTGSVSQHLSLLRVVPGRFLHRSGDETEEEYRKRMKEKEQEVPLTAQIAREKRGEPADLDVASGRKKKGEL